MQKVCTVQGANQISVGATKQYGYTAEQALRECGRAVTETAEVADAESLLRPAAQGLWTPSSDWQVSHASLFQVVALAKCYSIGAATCVQPVRVMMPSTVLYTAVHASEKLPCQQHADSGFCNGLVDSPCITCGTYSAADVGRSQEL